MLEPYYTELLHYARQRAPDRDTADDIVQEAYARVLALAARAGLRHPRAVLYRTLNNLLIDHYRRQRNGLLAGDAIEPDSLPAATDADPECHLMHAQRNDALLAAIVALPQRCRHAFILFKIDGLSQGEIAQDMGITRNMVEKHVMNGMRACQRCLADFDA